MVQNRTWNNPSTSSFHSQLYNIYYTLSMRDSWCKESPSHYSRKDLQKQMLKESPLLKQLTMSTETRSGTLRSSSAVLNRRPRVQQHILKLTLSATNGFHPRHNISSFPFPSTSKPRLELGAHNRKSYSRIKKGLTSSSRPQLILNVEERKDPFKSISKEQVEKMEKSGMYGLLNSGVLPRGVNISRFFNEVEMTRGRNQSVKVEKFNTFVT